MWWGKARQPGRRCLLAKSKLESPFSGSSLTLWTMLDLSVIGWGRSWKAGGLASKILEGECLSVRHTEKLTGLEQQWGTAEAGQGILKGTFKSFQRLQVTWKESTISKVTLYGTKKVLCKQPAGGTSPRNPASWTRQWCQRVYLVSKNRDREPSIKERWLSFRGHSLQRSSGSFLFRNTEGRSQALDFEMTSNREIGTLNQRLARASKEG